MRKAIAALCLLALPAAADDGFFKAKANDPQSVLVAYGWSDSGDLWSSPAQIYKDASGTVHLSGLIYRWGDPSASVAVYLPDGYRPATTVWIPIITNGTDIGTAIVRPGSCSLCGDVIILMKPDSAWASLSGISYRAQ